MTSLPDVCLEDQSGVPPVSNTVTLTTTPLNKEPLNLDSLKYGLKPIPPSHPRPDREKEGSAKGKREAAGPIVTTSDEDEPPTPPDSPRESRETTLSPTYHDHDYENISSPGGSSTASGPTYVRPPGFTFHAHAVAKPKVKKKKTTAALIAPHEGITPTCNKEPVPPRHRPKRDPLPMRMRALPQSFWQQPNNAHNASPAQNYSILPPLVTRDGEEVNELRPVSPTHEEPEKHPKLMKHEKQPCTTTKDKPERKLTVANTDLLFKLFEHVEKDNPSSSSTSTTKHTTVSGTRGGGVGLSNTGFSNLHKVDSVTSHRDVNTITVTRRGRPRKLNMGPVSGKGLLNSEDPYLADSVSEKLFPQLNREQRKAMLNQGGTVLQVLTIRGDGDKPVSLPSLGVDQNYSQMLSELVMHI